MFGRSRLWFVGSAAMALCTALAGCASAPTPEPVPNPLVAVPSDISEITEPEPTTASLTVDARRADAIVVAEVVALGPAPGRWTSPCAVQGATYRVAQVLKGTVAGSELRVAHKVCLGQPLIDNRTVGLATAWFEPGRRVVLFVERDAAGTVREARADGEWVSEYAVFDERCGVLPDSELLREQIAKAAAAGGKGTGGDPFR